jgi:hypothetical protein
MPSPLHRLEGAQTEWKAARALAKCKGHFALFNCLVLGYATYKGVQRPFPNKMFYRSHRMDPVIIRPPGVDNGAFVVWPETVWCARVLLLFSASAMTDTGSKSFDCAIVSTLETFDDPENSNYSYYTYYCHYVHYGTYAYYSHYFKYI